MVWGLTGLWHGAEWSFVFWGLLNGLYQVAERLCAPLRVKLHTKWKIEENNPWLAVAEGVFTFLLLTIAWIFFRAENMAQAIYVIKHILLILRDGFGLESALTLLTKRQALLLIFALIPCAIEESRVSRGKRLAVLDESIWRYWAAMLVLVLQLPLRHNLVLVLCIALFGIYGEGIDMRQFVYFQF